MVDLCVNPHINNVISSEYLLTDRQPYPDLKILLDPSLNSSFTILAETLSHRSFPNISTANNPLTLLRGLLYLQQKVPIPIRA